MRDLASICMIDKVWPLEGKDRVQGASMIENGYEAMVSKDIQPGQLVAFIQEGACLPVCENWEWLRKRCYKENLNGKEGFLIKPQKFKELKSWGLIVPLHELGLEEKTYSKFKSGQDITELLGIWKYEPEEDASPKTSSKKAYPKFIKFCLSIWFLRWIGRIWQSKHQNISGGFPIYIKKSDENNLQSMKNVLNTFKDEFVYTSCKLEGQSALAAFELNKKNILKSRFYVCSRNNAYKNQCSNTFWNWCIENDIEKKLKSFYKKTGKLCVIQAEQCGPGIQNNIYNFKSINWFVYLAEDIIKNEQLSLNEMIELCDFINVKTVPIIEKNIKLNTIMPDLNSAIHYAENLFWKIDKDTVIMNYSPNQHEKLWKDYLQHEGVVVRSVNCDKMKNIGISFKIKNIGYAEKQLSEIAKIAKS